MHPCRGSGRRISQVTAAFHTLLGLTSSAKEVAETAKSTEAAKQVAELTQDVVHRHTAAIAASAHLLAGKTELVIAGALVGVAEHIISLGRLFEFLLGRLFLGIALALLFVGVILDGQFAVSLLQVVGRGILVHSKHLVVISLLSHISLVSSP